MRLRRALAVLVAGASLLGLAGCEKPVPEVSVTSGRTFVTVPAAVYCFTVDDAAANRCRTDRNPPREITVREGRSVAIDVPSELAHTPWVVVLSDPGGTTTRERSPYQVDKTHLSLTPVFTASPKVLAEVVAYRSDGRAVRPVGLWRFLLVREPKPATPTG
jgi:hypothetical protein